MFSKIILNSKNLQHNLDFVKTQSHNAKVCAMVKANAYGHGLKEIVKLLSGHVHAFGVVNIEEALTVRKIDKKAMVIIFGVCENIEFALKNNISLAVVSLDNLKEILKVAKNFKIKPKLHLNINSGMNRFGINDIKEFDKIISLLKKNDIVLEGIFTHFSSLTTDDSYSFRQKKIFDSFVLRLPEKWKVLVHVGGGNSLLKMRGYEMYRIGMFLYGYGNENLKPVLSVHSKVVDLQKVKGNEHVGYMSAYTAKNDMQIGVIPLGYDDGIKRGLSNKLKVKINGKTCKNVGNICMDSFMIDITGLKVKASEEVEILSSASDWCEFLKTTEYEILVNFNGFRGERIIQ